MTMIFDYATKACLQEQIGKPLRYRETSMFGEEFTPNGDVFGSNRPFLTGHKREFFAHVTMKDGKIHRVV